MIIGAHVILSAYGFWLPNDPRGSWSDFVGSWNLLRFGRATKTDVRRSVASVPHDRRSRLAAKKHLAYPPVRFNGVQARAVGRGFSDFVRRSGVIIRACSILPDHVHCVVAKHRYGFEQVAALMKGAATRQLMREGIHPFARTPAQSREMPSVWARRQWVVFLCGPEDMQRAIVYVENNPAREGLPLQRWSFVKK